MDTAPTMGNPAMMTMMPRRRWFVAQTAACREAWARDRLTDDGFTVFLPGELRQRRHARQVKTTFGPLFTGYLFLHLAPDDAWPPISLARLVCAGTRPLPLPDAEIEALRRRCDADGALIQASARAQPYKPGDTVLVKAGQWADIVAQVSGVDAGRQRLELLFELLGRPVTVAVPAAAVQPAG
jgi:transcription antitermination factor NusG